MDKLDALIARLSDQFCKRGSGERHVLELFIDCIRLGTQHTPEVFSNHNFRSNPLEIGAALPDDMDEVDQHMRTSFLLGILSVVDQLNSLGARLWRLIKMIESELGNEQASLFDQCYATTMQQRPAKAQRAKLFNTFNELHLNFIVMSHQNNASNHYRRLGRRLDGPLRLYEAGSNAMRRLLYGKEAPGDIAGTFGTVLLADAMGRTQEPTSRPIFFNDDMGLPRRIHTDGSFLRDIGPWYAQLRKQDDRELFEELASAMWGWKPTEEVPRGQIDTEELNRLVDELRGQLEILLPQTANLIRDYNEDEYGKQVTRKDIPPDPPYVGSGYGLPSLQIPSTVLILLMGCIFKVYIAFLFREYLIPSPLQGLTGGKCVGLGKLPSTLFMSLAVTLVTKILFVPI